MGFKRTVHQGAQHDMIESRFSSFLYLNYLWHHPLSEWKGNGLFASTVSGVLGWASPLWNLVVKGLTGRKGVDTSAGCFTTFGSC